MPSSNVLVVEDDPFLRVIGILLDPTTSVERVAAFADFFAHDEPDFAGYIGRTRARIGELFPSQVKYVDTTPELRAALPEATGLCVESLPVAGEELAIGGRLKVVQKYGARTRNIDCAACAERGVTVLTLRRRANVACAEVVFALMLTLAKRLHRLTGRISAKALAAAGYPYRPFDSRHSPNSNWARIGGIGMLFGTTLGIIGLGEIGAEVAVRASAFGMRILYYQRTRLAPEEERALGVNYAPLEQLLGQSDWIVPQLPVSPSTRGLLGAAQFAQMKRGARLVNVSRADVVDRAALVDALRSGWLGGFGLDPQYQAPGRDDDELLSFPNVVLSPHIGGSPRRNGLDDLADLVEGMARALGC